MPKLLTVGKGKASDQSSVISDQSSDQKAEVRELLKEVKPKALRERLLKVWARI